MAIRMRTTLLLCLLSIPCGVILLSLAIVHGVLQKQIRREISADLERSISTFRNIETQREEILRREVSLLAALPVLKSLMTTSDEITIRDGAAEFSDLSGADLFALADGSGKLVAVFEGAVSETPSDFSPTFAFSNSAMTKPYFVTTHGKLYEVAFQPLYFGSPAVGTRLGYVLLGYAVDLRLAREVSQATSSDVTFYANDRVIATTLDDRYRSDIASLAPSLSLSGAVDHDIWFGSEHFVRASVLLSGTSAPQLQMVALKSYDRASQYVGSLDHFLLLLGGVLLLLSGVLGVYLSTSITRPLDQLVASARALGAGDFEYQSQSAGAREVRELSEAFDGMRCKLRSAREELIAAERLATIGRMASSISHDLRHYLSAVYANAEFLGYDSTRPEERQELLNEVRMGVRGMTDLIDSLLLFSRTGESLQLTCESLPYLAERAVAMVRAHPDAHNVRFVLDPMPHIEVWLDARKVERAIYNLLLNGCQAARQEPWPEIRIGLFDGEDCVRFSITDNGPGVPESVRASLFQPFVSMGKPSGTGLGLTLALKIAQEHGGSVVLEDSREGPTMFWISLDKATLRRFAEQAQRRERAANAGQTTIGI